MNPSNTTTTTTTSAVTTTEIGGSNSSQPSSQANQGFRFAGLFFKRADKTEKVKHSSLKRAKSGIQLERKKTPAHLQTGSNAAANNSMGSAVLSDAKSNNSAHLDYDSRHR